MRAPRFYIMQYVKFTAVIAVVCALVWGRSAENAILLFGMIVLIFLSPICLPLLPMSPESVLLNLPKDPDEQIAVLEPVAVRPVLLHSGAKRAVRIKLVQLYTERGRFSDAVKLGRKTLDQFLAPRALEGLLRLEISVCLDQLGRDSEARAERQTARERLGNPRTDALGWLVQGRLFDEDHCHDQAIVAYERVLGMPFFERRPLENEAAIRLTAACLEAGRPHEAIHWAECALSHGARCSDRYRLHEMAARAYAMIHEPHKNALH